MEDIEPMWYRCYKNVLCLLGGGFPSEMVVFQVFRIRKRAISSHLCDEHIASKYYIDTIVLNICFINKIIY